MKLMSFNINGIRARIHQLDAIEATLAPDILGLQEVKCADDAFPYQDLAHLPYHFETFGQKGHYGVALASRMPPELIQRGLPMEAIDAQRRMIRGDYRLQDGQMLTVYNGYFPQGESRDHETKFPYKAGFYRHLLETLQTYHRPTELIAIMGDFNIAPVDHDIGITADAKARWLRTGKTSFLPEERAWFDALTRWGLLDSWRSRHPEISDRFSWFDYRSRGFEDSPKRGLRIDHILVTASLNERILECGIDYAIRGLEKPSDHCPVWLTLDNAS